MNKISKKRSPKKSKQSLRELFKAEALVCAIVQAYAGESDAHYKDAEPALKLTAGVLEAVGANFSPEGRAALITEALEASQEAFK